MSYPYSYLNNYIFAKNPISNSYSSEGNGVLLFSSSNTIKFNYNLTNINAILIGGGGGGGGVGGDYVFTAGPGGGGGAAGIISGIDASMIGNYGSSSITGELILDVTVASSVQTSIYEPGPFNGNDTILGNNIVTAGGGQGGYSLTNLTINPSGGVLTTHPSLGGSLTVKGGKGGTGGKANNTQTPLATNAPGYTGVSGELNPIIENNYSLHFPEYISNVTDISNILYAGCGGGGGGRRLNYNGNAQYGGGYPGGGNSNEITVVPYTYLALGMAAGIGRGMDGVVYGGGGGGCDGTTYAPSNSEKGGDGSQGVVILWFSIPYPPPANGCDTGAGPYPPRVWPRATIDCIDMSGVGANDQPLSSNGYNLSEKRKAVIFQYKNNNINMSRKQLYSRLARGIGRQRGSTFATQSDSYTNANTKNLQNVNVNTGPLLCPNSRVISAYTSQNNTPGPKMLITNYPNAPLYNYRVRRTYVGGNTKWPQYGPNTGQPREPKLAGNSGSKPGYQSGNQ